MIDKLAKLIVHALRRASAERGGMPLLGTRREPGLFPANASGRAAAERACGEGLFLAESPENDLWNITDAGLNRLLAETSPRQVLEDCVRAIESRQEQLERIRATVNRTHANLDGLRATVENALCALSVTDLATTILDALARFKSTAAQDCPLPELYRLIQDSAGQPTIGAFHDALRTLRAEQNVDLHPWTGPLYDMPEPAYALMCGHEIVYYARGRAVGTTHADYQLAQTS